MRIKILDAATLGEDICLDPLESVGEIVVYENTDLVKTPNAASNADCIIVNKVKMNENTLKLAKELKLICVAATGFDNIDLDYCREKGIAVCNVKGYSTDSVAQITLAMVLSLASHLPEYSEFVESGEYTKSGVANRLVPVYHELSGKTWGIVGLGNIGKKVADVAKAMGCKVIAYKRTPEVGYDCVGIDTLCSEADVITIHTPLNDGTKNLISACRVAQMKKGAIVVNVARGAVCDEISLCEAAEKGDILLGVDVYSKEPFDTEHPYSKIAKLPNVCLTPHMAWGAYEARNRCIAEIAENIRSFLKNEKRNRLV